MDGQHHPLLRLCVGSQQSSIDAFKSLCSFSSQTEISHPPMCSSCGVERIPLSAIQLGVAIAITECLKRRRKLGIRVLHVIRFRVSERIVPCFLGPEDFGTANQELWYLRN